MARVLYFAHLKDRIGLAEETLDLPEDICDGRSLIGFLTRRHPHAEDALRSPALKLALDQEVRPMTARLAGVQEIALFPPMTGG